MIVPLKKLVIERKMQGMCRLPYPLHPKGCPNFGKKKGCPPERGLIDAEFDTSKDLFAIVSEFELGKHVERMRVAHPDWSERQLECCLYWQGTARKALSEQCRMFEMQAAGYRCDTCPEAAGVNVTETLARVGIALEWPPKKIVRQVAIAGLPIR